MRDVGARFRMWTAIRAQERPFAVTDIAGAAEVPLASARSYVRRLEALGYLARGPARPPAIAPGGAGRGPAAHTWILARDPGAAPPIPPEEGPPREAIWRTLRMSRRRWLTVQEVSHFAATGEAPLEPTLVTLYLAALAEAGILDREPRSYGKGARPARFRLARDLGPIAPHVQRRRVVLDGTGRVVWVEDAPLPEGQR